MWTRLFEELLGEGWLQFIGAGVAAVLLSQYAQSEWIPSFTPAIQILDLISFS